MADYLLNPLGEDKPIYDAVSIQGYQITQENDSVTVVKDNHPIVATQAGEVTVNNITQADWAVFQRIQQQACPPKNITDSIHLNGKDLNGKVGVEIDGEALLDQPSAETETAEAISLQATPPALSVLERETAKLPEGPTKSLLQTTTQDWKQQLQQGLQTGLKQGINWLATRPEAMRTQAAARAALDLFNRGYERTGEKAYSVEGFQLTLRGLNLYTLSDSKGSLLRFQAFKSSLPGVNQPRIQVLSRSNRLKPNLVRGLKELQHNSQVTPHGDLDQEANYVLKTNRLESVVSEFLQTRAKAKVWDREGGQYRLEIGDRDFLRITDKQGERGVVFQRQNGEVFSRLGAADFAHFDRLADRMEQVNQQPTKSIQVQPGVKQKGVGLAME